MVFTRLELVRFAGSRDRETGVFASDAAYRASAAVPFELGGELFARPGRERDAATLDPVCGFLAVDGNLDARVSWKSEAPVAARQVALQLNRRFD
jgi:hypothetical protein